MITEQLIRYTRQRYQELLQEAALDRQNRAGSAGKPSAADKALARTGDLLVTLGQGLQRRYRRLEEGMVLGRYSGGQRMGRAR